VNKLHATDLEVSNLCLGTFGFGWLFSESASFEVLDAYVAAGGNFIDTADVYGGGASESVIGAWMAARGNRESVVLATKLGWEDGLSRQNIVTRLADSLRRLQVDHIDIYFAHRDDTDVPFAETINAFRECIAQGKVGYIGASNFAAHRVSDALHEADRIGGPRFVAVQSLYNLMERTRYETDMIPVCEQEHLSSVPYRALAQGFLTGRYRAGDPLPDSDGGTVASSYLAGRGPAVLAALDEIAAAHHVSVGAVSVAWLLRRPTVATAIASARSAAQLMEVLPAMSLQLSDSELQQLDRSSAS
jgi:aryl-alcohol dehydrogenase-like predicted oxidoreductase